MTWIASLDNVFVSFLCELSLLSVSGSFIHLYCVSSWLGSSTRTLEVKSPPLLSHSKYICCKYIIEDRGKIPSLIAFYKLFLSDIKVKTLINSWHIFMLFFGCALCCPLIDTINFQRMKGIKVVHIPGKFCWYRICSSWVKFSNVFAAANCHFRLLLGDFLARTPKNVLNFVWKFEQWRHARWCIRYA